MAKTILVADDSVTIRKVVELTFHDTEIRVESTGNGREALERIATLQPDLVLADVIMPEPSGYEICRAVKSSSRPVPVLLLAGAFEPFDPDRARDCGADGHVVKPFESRALFERVDALLRGPARAEETAAPEASAAEVDSLMDELAQAPGRELPGQRGAARAPEDALDWLLGPEEKGTASRPATPAESTGGEDRAWLPAEMAPPGSPDTVASEAPQPAPGEAFVAAGGAFRLSAEELDALVRVVVERLSDRVVREIAWEIVPSLAESIIRERIRQLEKADPERI